MNIIEGVPKVDLEKCEFVDKYVEFHKLHFLERDIESTFH